MEKFETGNIVVATHTRASEAFGDIEKGTLLLYVKDHPKNKEHILVTSPGTKVIDAKLVPIHRAIIRKATDLENLAYIKGVLNIKELEDE